MDHPPALNGRGRRIPAEVPKPLNVHLQPSPDGGAYWLIVTGADGKLAVRVELVAADLGALAKVFQSASLK